MFVDEDGLFGSAGNSKSQRCSDVRLCHRCEGFFIPREERRGQLRGGTTDLLDERAPPQRQKSEEQFRGGGFTMPRSLFQLSFTR